MTHYTEIVDAVKSVDELLHTPEAKASTPVEITLDEAKELLARAVQEKGESHVYEHVKAPRFGELCAYFDPDDGAPSCIVGHVLAYKGLTVEALRLGETDLNTYAAVDTLKDANVIKVDNGAQALLEIAQSEQDEGQTWGRAVEEALETYEDRAKNYEEEGYDDPSEAYDLPF